MVLKLTIKDWHTYIGKSLSIAMYELQKLGYGLMFEKINNRFGLKVFAVDEDLVMRLFYSKDLICEYIDEAYYFG